MELMLMLFIVATMLVGSRGQHNICSTSSLTASSGNITSPNYPLDYGDNLDCTTKINAPANKVIKVSFLDFDVESGSACKFDELKIFDGTVQHSSRPFCGTEPPNPFVAHHPEVSFRFKSDSSQGEKGFFIHWNFIDRCADNEFTCWDGTCIPSTQHCDGTQHCTDDSDEIECTRPSLNFAECGKSDVAPAFYWDTRIVGGNEAEPNAWPWQARLSISTPGSASSACGGSIINPEWILTAAHCTHGSSSVQVDAGIHSLVISTQQRHSKRIINHPSYNDRSLENDIALIELNSPLTLTSKFRPVCLPEDTGTFDIPAGTTCIATGWGNLDDTHDNPTTLHQVRLPIVDSTTCRQAQSNLRATQICAGNFNKGGVDTCQGDSGGPLVCLINQQTWYIIGLTSFGGNCAAAKSPGIYTRVSKYREWINSQVPELATTTTISTTTTTLKTATTTFTTTTAPTTTPTLTTTTTTTLTTPTTTLTTTTAPTTTSTKKITTTPTLTTTTLSTSTSTTTAGPTTGITTTLTTTTVPTTTSTKKITTTPTLTTTTTLSTSTSTTTAGPTTGQHNICSTASLTTSSGNLTSPNYPSNYGNDLNCSTKISAPANKVIRVSFLGFDLQSGSACKFDELKIFDGTVQHSSRGFCGTEPPNSFVAHHPEVSFRFKSDSSQAERGFFIHWNFIDRCADNEFTCWDGTCIPSTQHCDGTQHCSDNSDEIECTRPSLSYAECGKSDVAPMFHWDERISGGNEAEPNAWPWKARLSITGRARASSACGGAIINSKWILTAAHCTLDGTSVQVDAGIHLLEVSTQQRHSKRIINHPNYHSSSPENDIALIELDSPLTFTSYFRPVCLPEDTSTFDIPAGTTCIATGWGNLYDNHGNPNTLHQVRLPIVDSTTCRKTQPNLTTTQICAGDYSKGGVGTCQGDSGGPLVCLINQQTWYIIGITSSKENCAKAKSPGIYTRVSKYRSWINSHVSTTSAHNGSQIEGPVTPGAVGNTNSAQIIILNSPLIQILIILTVFLLNFMCI